MPSWNQMWKYGSSQYIYLKNKQDDQHLDLNHSAQTEEISKKCCSLISTFSFLDFTWIHLFKQASDVFLRLRETHNVSNCLLSSSSRFSTSLVWDFGIVNRYS